MLTRCPACVTTFRVTPEQLKLGAGRVRCGQCNARFNALDSLQDEPRAMPAFPVAAPPAIESPAAMAHDETTASNTATLAEPPTASVSDAGTPLQNTEPVVDLKHSLTHYLLGIAEEAPGPSAPQEAPATYATPTPAPHDAEDEPPDPAINPPASIEDAIAPPVAAPEPPESVLPDGTDHEPVVPSVETVSEPGDVSARSAHLSPLPAAETNPNAQAPETPPTRMTPSLPQYSRSLATFEEWQEAAEPPPRRWPWIAGTLLATLALVAQATLHYRVELAVLQPQLKPVLMKACQLAGCTVTLPRKAEYLGIESSDLHPDPDRPGHLLLSATLRNRAPFAQEFPLLEITLNDVADHALITKDLKPEEYLPADVRPAQGFGINAEIAVNLTLEAGDVTASGYRLYLFYP